ncbi:MAG: hypothetical protein ACPG45_06330 [Flavobacteriaceae bacterium]
MLKNKLQDKGELSRRLLELEVFTFLNAIDFVKKMPYGRNSDRANSNLVLEELKGTCSTKHAVLKKIALEQESCHVKLYLCIFKMHGSNTPKLKSILDQYALDYIPEAHCILKVAGKFVDVTNAQSAYENIKNDVLEQVEIQPEQIGDYKVNYHQAYLNKWLKAENRQYSFEELWKIREQCINRLAV